ncbi:hypothetical protein [Lentzea californiensis]|uniref:hypothetical protein n=1 Tax=Lentzea californiensis TaxID=438851 RepID=UPI003557F867
MLEDESGFHQSEPSDSRPSPGRSNFGRVFVGLRQNGRAAGSLAWVMVVGKFRFARYDVTGAVICLIGVAVSRSCRVCRPARTPRPHRQPDRGNSSCRHSPTAPSRVSHDHRSQSRRDHAIRPERKSLASPTTQLQRFARE